MIAYPNKNFIDSLPAINKSIREKMTLQNARLKLKLGTDKLSLEIKNFV